MLVTLRVYIGLDYECPRGHRLFLSGADRLHKSLTSVTASTGSDHISQVTELFTSVTSNLNVSHHISETCN